MHDQKPKPPFPWGDPFQVSLLSVRCAICGAAEGVPCTILGGPVERFTHLRRADKAIRKANRIKYGRPSTTGERKEYRDA